MYTTLEVQFKKAGETIALIADLICSNNSGENQFSLDELKAIIKGRKVVLSHSLKNLKIEEEGNKILIFENGINLNYIVAENKNYIITDTPLLLEVNEDDDEEEGYCRNCSGSGEGMHDGSTCNVCKGSGSDSPVKRPFKY